MSLLEDYRQSAEYNNFFRKQGWVVEKIDNTSILIRHLPFVGSVIKIQRSDPQLPLSKIDEMVKKHNAFLVKLEPKLETSGKEVPAILERLKKFGYTESSWALCPTRTIHLDLTPDLDKILARTKKDVRRYLSKNRGKNFEFRRDRELEDFYALLQKAGKLKGCNVPKIEKLKLCWGAFGSEMKLLLGYKEGKLLGGSLTLCRDEAAAGIYMATSKEGLVEHFPYSLMWESIKLSKEAGCKILDLDGIYDPRYRTHKAWKGLTQFKRKFGGREVEFVGSFTKCKFLPLRIMAKSGLI